MHTRNLAPWTHDHSFDKGNPAAERGTRAVVWITGAMMLVEIVAGWWCARRWKNSLQCKCLTCTSPPRMAESALFSRYAEPERDQQLLLAKLGWALPPQAPPRITCPGKIAAEM